MCTVLNAFDKNAFSREMCVYVVKGCFGRGAHVTETVSDVCVSICTVWKDFDLYKSEGTNIHSATLVKE